MHKIRLYVVQEQEEAPDEEDFDEPDYPPPMMQRRNSRRPGAVRVNVIQKDRKAVSISPKLKQIRQEMNKCDVNSLEKTLSLSNRRGNLVRIENGVRAGKSKIPPPLPVRTTTLLPRKTVFASPRIKQLALNLQEKMIERNAKIQGENIANGNAQVSNQNIQVENKNVKIGNEHLEVGNENLQIRNENVWVRNENLQDLKDENIKLGVRRLINRNEHFLRGLTPIIEKLNGNGEVDEIRKVERQKNGNPWISKRACEYDELVEGDEMENDRDERFDSRSPKMVRVKSDVDQGDMIQDDDCVRSGDGGATIGSVILCRNNKLNRYREYDLEQKIEVEIKMREGSARLLAAARHRAQSLEAARALLTSNERMSAYMAELQRRKKEPSNKTSLPASTARVSLSDLRVPLMWRDSDHFKNRGDYRRFAVFCLARVGTEIHDTALLCPVDRALTDISFPDVLVFNNVPAEFELTLEIYSHILQEDLSIASTPRRIKRTIHSSISKTVGKKLAASLRDELNSGKIGPHFELMASARLTLDDTDDNIHTHDLVINNLENKHHALPLFGHFCCRLAAQPDCMSKEICTGNINLNGRNCWARLQGFEIRTWESRKLSEEDQSPSHIILVNRETSIQPSKSSKELRIVNNVDGTEKTAMIRLDTSEEAQRWLRQLNTHAKDHLRWKHAAESIQDVPCVESARNSFISNKRQGSLYDETPLIESVQLDYASTRPTVQEIFGLTPSTSLSSCSSSNSPPCLRSRSLSTSGPRKLSSSALKSHWPFSNKSHD